MSLLTPERVPVKVYRWDDADAPVLDKTAGCMMAIFKACLVTGYGTKESAGWTMPYEDAAAGVKVLRPEVGAETDFYLRLSADTGTEMAAQIYLNMTGVNTGDLKLQCATPFKYAKTNISGKWVLIATPRTVWFLSDQSYSGTHGKNGSWLVAGDIASNDIGQRAVYLHHTGGITGNISFATLTGTRAGLINKTEYTYVSGKLLLNDNSVVTSDPICVTDGTNTLSADGAVMPVVVTSGLHVYQLVGVYIPFCGAAYNSFNTVQIAGANDYQQMIVCGTGVREANNVYVSADFWSY